MTKTPFVPGNKYGKGRKPLDPELKVARDALKVYGKDWYEHLGKFLAMPIPKINEQLKDITKSSCEFAAGKFLLATLNSRDPRLFGPLCKMIGVEFDAPVKIQHSLEDNIGHLDETELDSRIALLSKMLYGNG